MALCARLQRLFERERPTYSLVPHREVFTAPEVAAASHLPGREVAKVILLRDEGGAWLMLALPAPARLDLSAIELATGRKGLRLGSEAEFSKLFKDCDPGAMPPFGSLYDMPLYLDACLAASPEIAFQAGNHHEVVVMSYAEYARLAQPVVGRWCFHHVRQRVAS